MKVLWLLKKSKVDEFKNTTHSLKYARFKILETIDETISFEASVS